MFNESDKLQTGFSAVWLGGLVSSGLRIFNTANGLKVDCGRAAMGRQPIIDLSQTGEWPVSPLAVIGRRNVMSFLNQS
jgi:hypothetical protein